MFGVLMMGTPIFLRCKLGMKKAAPTFEAAFLLFYLQCFLHKGLQPFQGLIAYSLVDQLAAFEQQ